MNIQIGQQAPEFDLPDQNGQHHKLTDYLGKWVLLYFYPQDGTSGCTKEACGLRDTFPNFKNIGAEVLGVSPDSPESHKKFIEKYNLPFTLLADEQKEVIQQYGVWGEKEMGGKKFMGLLRTSFLINPKGEVAKIYENVNPEVHAKEVLADITELNK